MVFKEGITEGVGIELDLEKQKLKKGNMAKMCKMVCWKLAEEDYKASNSKKYSAHPGTSTHAYKSGPPCITAIEGPHQQPNATAEQQPENSST